MFRQGFFEVGLNSKALDSCQENELDTPIRRIICLTTLLKIIEFSLTIETSNHVFLALFYGQIG